MIKGELVKFGSYEWYSEKNNINKKKHGVTFEEATKVFDDPYFYEVVDIKHTTVEQIRYVGMGYIINFNVIVLSYTEINKHVHIISARYAKANERKVYYDRYAKFHSGT